MLDIRRTYLNHKGFTLIEVILALAICSIIILPIFRILDFSIDACAVGEGKDQLILNGRYAIEYIKYDIRSADRIISSDKIQGLKNNYPTNIGFVIMMFDDRQAIYRYITYHTKNDKLVRTACERIDEKYPPYSYLKGHNDLCEFIEHIGNTKLDTENSMIYLEFDLTNNAGSNLKLKSNIYVRCPIDY